MHAWHTPGRMQWENMWCTLDSDGNEPEKSGYGGVVCHAKGFGFGLGVTQW